MENNEQLVKEIYTVKGKGVHLCGALVKEDEGRYRMHGWMTLNNKDRQYFCSGRKDPEVLRIRFENLSRTIATIFDIKEDHKILENPVLFDKSILMEMATNTHFN